MQTHMLFMRSVQHNQQSMKAEEQLLSLYICPSRACSILQGTCDHAHFCAARMAANRASRFTVDHSISTVAPSFVATEHAELGESAPPLDAVAAIKESHGCALSDS